MVTLQVVIFATNATGFVISYFRLPVRDLCNTILRSGIKSVDELMTSTLM